MRIKHCTPAFLFFLLSACTEPPPPLSAEQQFTDSVADALGGAANIQSSNTLTMEAEGSMLNLGQDMTPEAATMVFSISGYRLQADLANRRSRTELTRTPLFDYFRGRDPMQMASGIDGDIAYDIAADGSARRAHDDVAAERQSTYYHHPLPLLRSILDGAATLSNFREEDGNYLADVNVSADKTFTLGLDLTTGLPAFIYSTDYHGYLRDVVRRTEFSNYVDAGDLKLPSTIKQTLDEFQAFELNATVQQVNVNIDDLSAPSSVTSAPPVTGGGTANVTAESLGDGVWLLAGQSHHSVLFEFDDHLKLLEAPNEVRTLAVIAKAKELVPDKPLTHLINTHHHFDHSGGVRTAVAEGLTIVTQAVNAPFYRRMAEQPSTLKADALSRSPRPITIETVDDKRVYQDDSMTVELYHVNNSPHSSSILMAYLPEERILIEADLYNPGRTTPQLFAPNMLDNILENNLDIERIVPIHGGIIPFGELEAAVEALRN